MLTCANTFKQESFHFPKCVPVLNVYITVSSYVLSNPVNPNTSRELIVLIAKRHHSFIKCKLNSGILGITQ